MNAHIPNRRRVTRVALAIGALAFAAGCDQHETPIASPLDPSALTVGFDVSSLAARPGDHIAVAVRADLPGERLAGLQGYLRFDPSRLRYVGQIPAGPTLAMLNDAAAARGELRLLSMNVAGLERRTAVLVFAVKAPDYGRTLRYALEVAATIDGREIRRATAAFEPALVADLAARPDARSLTMEDWNRLLAPDRTDAARAPAGTPGQYLLNLRYGDATLSGSVNVLDFSYIANAAVGNQQIIIGTDAPARDAAVAGNVRPANLNGLPAGQDLGEVGDPNPPGLEANGTRVINVVDALAIANEAVGNNQTIAGELIPGRGPLATNRIIVPAGDIAADQTWTADNIYELAGIVKVNNAATLTIAPGTRVEGVLTSALFIERTGRVIADGTPLQPIVFTCTAAIKTRGCWGGLWIAGNAPLNEGTLTSPAIPSRGTAGGCAEKIGEGGATLYGGCNPDDSSGVLRYVVEEYSGRILAANNELNGVTLGGVGRRTVIDYLQVHSGLDDGVELFGGTVNLKHLYLTANSDDAFDISFGWNGAAQFVIVQSDSLDGDKGIEADNTETSATYGATPRTNPQLYNFTFVGEAAPTSTSGVAGNNVNDALHLRRGTRPEIRNAILLSFVSGLDLDDDPTCDTPYQPVQRSLFVGMPNLGNADGSDPAGCGGGTTAEQNTINDVANNNVTVTDPLLVLQQLLSPFNVIVPDFRPRPGTVAATTVGATPPATHPGTGSPTGFDVTATYLGAVPPATATGGNIPWYSGWTRGWQNSTQP